MGKKAKGGRRQILQLEEKKPQKTSSKSKGKNLKHHSDSDEEDSKKSNESTTFSQAQSAKDSTPMDSEIADFFKEIDALTVPKEEVEQTSSSPPEEQLSKVNEGPDSPVTQPEVDANETNQPDEAKHEEQAKSKQCAWQEICDESTGYSYYWNMYTNDVTWDCPEEYALYVKSLNSSASKPAEDESSKVVDKKKKRKKEPEKLPEGAIIPISYFGYSSSDESSGSDSESPKPSKVPKIEPLVLSKKTKTSKKRKAEESSKSEIIGPQLPLDFQFTLAKQKETVVYGPSLPPNFAEIQQSEAKSDSVEDSMPEFLTKAALKNKIEVSSDQPTSFSFGLRSVVDYDSFTDEEEEEEPSPSALTCQVGVGKISATITENNFEAAAKMPATNDNIEMSKVSGITEEDRLIKEHSSTQVENDSTLTTLSESTKVSDEATNLKTANCITVESVKNEYKKNTTTNKPQTITSMLKNFECNYQNSEKGSVDIDSLFAAHSSFGKFGFGFREQSDIDVEVSSPRRQEFYKCHSDKKAVSFIKSEYILDLGTLNEVPELDSVPELNNIEIPINVLDVSSVIEDKSEDKAAKKTNEPEDACVVKDSEKQSDEEEGVVFFKNILDVKCEDKASTVKEDGIVESMKVVTEADANPVKSPTSDSSSFDFTDDLDEIDKALCEAMDKKKIKKNPELPIASVALKKLQPDNKESIVKESTPEQQTAVLKEEKLKAEKDFTLMAKINDASKILIDKLTFLLSNTISSLPGLDSLYIQLQTRFLDWQAEALNTGYFEARLAEVSQYLQHYESGVVSGDWTCQWDRSNKRYFYLNTTTQVSQWTFPEEMLVAAESSDSIKTSQLNLTEPKDESENVSPNIVCKDAPSPPPPPPGVDLDHHPPPPSTPPPASPPPFTSSEAGTVPEDMDLDDSNDSFVKELSPEPQFIQNSASFHRSLSSPGIDGTPFFPDTAQEDMQNSTVPLEILPLNVAEHTECELDNKATPPKPTSKPTKKKKVKIQPSLGLRKKNIPSLVEKWQKIKEAQEKEDTTSNVPKPPIDF